MKSRNKRTEALWSILVALIQIFGFPFFRMDDHGPGSLHCVLGGLSGLASLFRLSSTSVPGEGGS